MTIYLLHILLFLHQLQSVFSITISPCAKWERNGTVVAGTGSAGSAADQLDEPVGVAIFYPTNSLYIADHRNARIQMISLNDSSKIGTSVISQIRFPLHVYVDDENNDPVIYVTLSIDSHVEKWKKGAQAGEKLAVDCNGCVGIALDQARNIYVTDTNVHKVVRLSLQGETTIVAGNDSSQGSAPELLNVPQGLYVTRSGDTVYVADSGNSRIQKWTKGAAKGITVAGLENGTDGTDWSALSTPINVMVDEVTQVVYVADTYNHRIMRWLPGAVQGDIIAGLGGEGNNDDQLRQPSDLKFDLEGNLYVSDMKNHRVQRFRLIDNQSCGSSAPGRYSMRWTSISLALLWVMILAI